MNNYRLVYVCLSTNRTISTVSSSLLQSRGEINVSRSNEIKLWLLLLCSLVLALQPARADVVMDWSMAAVSTPGGVLL
jgi:hypothetical protein